MEFLVPTKEHIAINQGKSFAFAPILNKLRDFLSTPMMRNIVGQNRGGSDFREARLYLVWRLPSYYGALSGKAQMSFPEFPLSKG